VAEDGLFADETPPENNPDPANVDTPPADPPENRPEWLPEKFKTPEDLAKSYGELEKRLSQGGQAPEAYDLTLPDGLDSLGDDLFQDFRDGHLSNKQAQAVVDSISERILPSIYQAKAEKEELILQNAWGSTKEEATSRYQLVKTWAEKHFKDQPESLDHLKSASGILFLESEMKRLTQSQRADPSTDRAVPETTMETLNRMRKDPRMNKYGDKYDPEYHRRVTELSLQIKDPEPA